MRHLRRTLAVCALAALAIGVAGAASASATDYPLTGLPEIGRCVKAPTPLTGEFKGPKCVAKQLKKEGEYNWKPGAEKAGVKIRLVGFPTLETTDAKQIKCEYVFLEDGQEFRRLGKAGAWCGSRPETGIMDGVLPAGRPTHRKAANHQPIVVDRIVVPNRVVGFE